MVRTTEQGWSLPLLFTALPWHTDLTRLRLLFFRLHARPWAQSQTLSAIPKSTGPDSHGPCLQLADLTQLWRIAKSPVCSPQPCCPQPKQR